MKQGTTIKEVFFEEEINIFIDADKHFIYC
jgi:hypothetical protein